MNTATRHAYIVMAVALAVAGLGLWAAEWMRKRTRRKLEDKAADTLRKYREGPRKEKLMVLHYNDEGRTP